MAAVADSQPRMSRGRRTFALIPAAVAAWTIITAKDVLWPFLTAAVDEPSRLGDPLFSTQLGAMLMIYAAVGIPIALIVCLVLGLPAWMLAERWRLHTGWDAIRVGSAVGLVVFLCDALFSIMFGLATAVDPNSYSSSSDSIGKIMEDGLPTLYGWLLKLISLPVDVVAGAVAGWVAWATAGMKRRS